MLGTTSVAAQHEMQLSSALGHLSCTPSSASQAGVLALFKHHHAFKKAGPAGFCVKELGAATVCFAAKPRGSADL